MTAMTDDDSFLLSRIEAQGWNAAHRVIASGREPSDRVIDGLNPHPSGPERARWRIGFTNALARADSK